MKIRLKKLLNKHKNRIVSFIAVFVSVPLFAFNAFAFNFPLSAVSLSPSVGDGITFRIRSNTSGLNFITAVYDGGEFSTEFHVNNVIDNITSFEYCINNPFVYNFNFDVYDYYVGFNLF